MKMIYVVSRVKIWTDWVDHNPVECTETEILEAFDDIESALEYARMMQKNNKSKQIVEFNVEKVNFNQKG